MLLRDGDQYMKLFLAFVLSVISTVSFANEGGPKTGPCKKIVDACSAAGFKRGEHKDKKGLWKDCVEPLKEGQSVAGVNIDKSDIEACKSKREKMKNKRLENKEGTEPVITPVKN